jgi:hypothetical protein
MLAAAVAEVRKIENRRLAIVAFDDALASEITALLNDGLKARASYQAAKASGDIGQVKGALRKWLSAIPPIESLNAEMKALTRETALDAGRVTKLSGEYPLKDALLKLCQCRLVEAQEKATAIAETEQTRLNECYGAEYDAQESQPVKRARQRVEWLTTMQKQIVERPVEESWLLFAKDLLG